MGLLQRLLLLQQRNLINYHIVEVVLNIEGLLRHQWQVNTETAQVQMLLIHLANALGRIKRGYAAQPLNQAMFAEMKRAVDFPKILYLHQQILNYLPFNIPESEQTHFIANLYSLSLEQPQILKKYSHLIL
ncbi:PRD domain-containing protein [Volucribacter amazonae]|uniref:PRD domain-containing protein n=1 Tax=Volucribacter amazonae TaxID=256731 RepID=A0A9X4SIL2_9PAST|nr:PRD domain-containing protein [Volucribacter amazonae]MDG6895767.1 hypothetical protein [Volucribacter amazonae]